MKLEGKVGPRPGADGNEDSIRLGKTGETIVADAHARYFEAVSRGNCFGVANQAGVTSAAGFSAANPILALFNPKDSGVLAKLMFAGVTQLAAFAAGAAIWLAINNDAAATDVSGTDAVPRNLLIGNKGRSRVQAFTGATLPAAPVGIALLGAGLTGTLATAYSVPSLQRFFDGSIILKPGTALSFQTSTASGANGLLGELQWEEVPIIGG